MAGGRPSKYKEEYPEQVYKLCLLGATDKDIAAFFDVEEKTVNNWKEEHPEFFQSLKSGKQEADMNVANSLYTKALGFKERVVKAIKCKTVLYENGKRLSEVEDIKYAEEDVYVPPDTTAMIFWLKNRQKSKWRDKVETELTGPGGGPIETIDKTNPELVEARIRELIAKRDARTPESS